MGITISRDEQQGTTFQVLKPWLAYYLKNDVNGLNNLNSLLQSSSATNYQSICTSFLGVEEQGNWLTNIFWEINNRNLTIHFKKSIKGASLAYNIQNLTGQTVTKKHPPIKESETVVENLDTLSPGLYVLTFELGKKSKTVKFQLR
jgi:hypothetical protein